MKQTRIAGLFKTIFKMGGIRLVYWSISLYIAYLCSSLFLFITPSIDEKDLNVSLLLFIILTFLSYFLVKMLIKKEITIKNSDLRPYVIFSYILMTGVIITLILSVYYLNLWFKASVFEDKYTTNYDLKVKNITIVFLSASLFVGLLTFFLIKSRKTPSDKSPTPGIGTLKLFLKIVLVGILDLFIGLIIYTFINISFGVGFPFGG